MRLITLLKNIHRHRFQDPIPSKDLNEVNRELIIVKGMIEGILDDQALSDEEQKEKEFEKELNDAIISEHTHIDNAVALNIIEASCDEAGVKLKINRP